MSAVRICQLTDAVCSRWCAAGPCKLDDAQSDKIEGLSADLETALGVLYRHGDAEARSWLFLNYPTLARNYALAQQ